MNTMTDDRSMSSDEPGRWRRWIAGCCRWLNTRIAPATMTVADPVTQPQGASKTAAIVASSACASSAALVEWRNENLLVGDDEEASSTSEKPEVFNEELVRVGEGRFLFYFDTFLRAHVAHVRMRERQRVIDASMTAPWSSWNATPPDQA